MGHLFIKISYLNPCACLLRARRARVDFEGPRLLWCCCPLRNVKVELKAPCAMVRDDPYPISDFKEGALHADPIHAQPVVGVLSRRRTTKLEHAVRSSLGAYSRSIIDEYEPRLVKGNGDVTRRF